MGYMAYGPTINFDFSGMQIKSASELRATWPNMSDEDKHKAATLMYGDGHDEAVQLLDKALGGSDKDLDENPVANFVARKAAGIIANKAPSIGATAGAAAHRVKKVTNQVFKSNGKSNHTVGSARVPGASGYTKPGDETNALDVLASSQKNRNKKIKKESSDLVMDKESLIDYLQRAITKFAEQETDVEKLSYILKKLSGKKIATRNDRYYTITDEDVQEGLGRVLKGLK
jgi:hypothetical protein